MSEHWLIISVIGLYFITLMIISWRTGVNAGNDAFFLGEKKSPWYIVAYGMIGASLSGVTFISVPGWVGDTHFAYFQMVLGYVVGYYVIAFVLMPVYYKMNLVSIYTYLESRFGRFSYKTGAFYFILSRLIGASFRLYLVAIVFELIFEKTGWNIPFYATVIITVLLIWIYTNKGGIKTIIWTDTLQTTFMLLAVIFTIISIKESLFSNWSEMFNGLYQSEYSTVFVFDDFNSSRHFFKYFVSGAFIAIAMTGLDQDMMQKNLSCKNIGEARKNMITFSWILVFVNLMFLGLGALLYMYSSVNGLVTPEKTDYLFPMIALSGDLGLMVLISFVLGLIASAYSSADSALTALTTSFSVDVLDLNSKYPEERREAVRRRVHIFMSLTIVLLILLFRIINNDSVISNLMLAAGYTYGPLLGLYSFGFLTKWEVKDQWIPILAVLSPLLAFFTKSILANYLPDFQIGFELILLNASITFAGLLLLRTKGGKKQFV